MTALSNTLSGTGLLYTIEAVIIMDNEGKRLLAKYYYAGGEQGARGGEKEKEKAESSIPSTSQLRRAQDAFESTLFARTRKALNNEVTTCEGHIVVYKANLDVILYVVGRPQQTELLLACALDTLYDTLTEVVKPQLDKRALLEHFDLVTLALDEIIDRGIVLETDVPEIVSRISKTPTSIVDMPLNEQTLSSAFSFAKQQLKSFLK